MVFNNSILIQWGRATHPKVSADSTKSATVTLPCSFSAASYSVAIAMVVDAGRTNYLRQNGLDTGISEMTFYWYSTNFTLNSTGSFSWMVIGY